MYRARALRLAAVVLSSCLLLVHAASAWSAPVEPPALAGIPVDFILFAVTLVGIALFHHYTLPIAVGGLIVVSLWKIGFSPFLGDSLLLIPFLCFWILWPNWGATLYGEVRGASDFRKNIYAMGGALVFMTVITVITLGAMAHSVGLDFYGIQLPKQAAPLMKYAERLFSRPAFIEALTASEKVMRK